MYIPRHLIQENLYTRGGEFITSDTGENYTGYYWQNSRNEAFTGKTPQDTPTVRLLVAVPEEDDNETFENPKTSEANWTTRYSNITNSQPGQLPTRFFPNPSQSDYDFGEFERYFAKKSNQNIYLEINKEQFNQIQNQDERILFQLYIPISVSWQLDGTIEEAYLENKRVVSRLNQPGFTEWFRNDFTKFHHSKLDSN